MPIVDAQIEEMFKIGAQFGYSSSKRHPKMKPYIFTSRNGTEIFDLEKTKSKLDLAKDFLKNLAKEKKTVLFVGTKKEAKEIIKDLAKKIKMPYVAERWLGGTMTNFKEIKGRIDYLNDLLQKKSSGELDKYTKKEKSQIEKKIASLERYLSGLKQYAGLPSAIVIIDPDYEEIAAQEARKIKIPVIALMSSDCDPADVDFPIPANDNSVASIQFFLKELIEAYDNNRTD